MKYDLEWIAGLGIDIKTGFDYTGNEDKFVSAIQRFCKGYEKNKSKIDEFYGAGDYENYMITVHALKSNAKMIGAMGLSKMFETLEMASRNGDKATVDGNNAGTVNAYKDLVDKLKPVCELGDVKAPDEITVEEARETADKLLEALDDFDDDLSKELVNKLSGYPFRITQKEKLKEAIGFVDDFLYNEAAEIIKEIYETIE